MVELVFILLVGLCCSMAGEPEAPGTQAPELPPVMLVPQIRLEPTTPDQGLSDEAYAAWLEEEFRRLKALPEPTDPEASVQQHAACGNWILSVYCEPALTWMLLGQADPAELSLLMDKVKQALGLLSKASTADDQNLENLELLVQFARAFQNVIAAKLGEADPEEINDAATDLTIWLDDERPSVASRASLWLGLLYAETDQRERALAFLPLPLTPFQNDRGSFFARLQRCRMFAEGQSRSLALTLLLKMEERCAEWFDVQTAEHARNTCTYLRFQIGRQQREQLRPLTRDIMQEWVDRAAADLTGQEGEPATLLRLYPAIPLLFTLEHPAREEEPAPPANDIQVEPIDAQNGADEGG